MKNLPYRNLELCSRVPGSPSPPPFAKIRLRKKLLKFVCLERTLERVPFEQVGLSHPLGASAPFIAERRQPAWSGLERPPRGVRSTLGPFRRGSRTGNRVLSASRPTKSGPENPVPLAPLRKPFKPPKSPSGLSLEGNICSLASQSHAQFPPRGWRSAGAEREGSAPHDVPDLPQCE